MKNCLKTINDKMIYSNKGDHGFSIVELVVTIGIFAMMTALLVAKYGNFNQGTLLTNLAYDVALTIRNAQSYGLNVKNAPATNGDRFSNNFNIPYGVRFANGAKDFVFYADSDSNGIYKSPDIVVSDTSIKRNSSIGSLCIGSSESDCSATGVTFLDVTFRRPDPNAIITKNNDTTKTYGYAEITLKASDGSVKIVTVRSNGQIAVKN